MNEKLLQYIWQYQYFNSRDLELSNGSSLVVVDPGKFNNHQGPDFLEGKCRIDDTVLIGHIELHIRASDWNRHSHQHDPNYANVILHVVLYNDQPANLSGLPTLVLQDRVPQMLLSRYNTWMNSKSSIPCEGKIVGINELVLTKWKETLVINRLQRKGAQLDKMLTKNNYHWEEAFWYLLARTFGGKINGEAFESIARSLSLNIMARHKTQIIQLEALLLGQGNILDKKYEEAYPVMLQKEYRFLRKKYGLIPIREPLHFLRMRPINFPTVRLVQLAMLFHQSGQLFTTIQELLSLAEIRKIFDITANDYWHYHFLPDHLSNYLPKKVGQGMIDNIIINAVVPAVYWQGKYNNSRRLMEKAINWLEELKPEANKHVQFFQSLGFSLQTAADSQAILELKTNWCDEKLCLNCAIGNSLLKREMV